MNELLTLLQSGLSLSSSIEVLVSHKSRVSIFRLIQSDLQSGVSIPRAFGRFFPWWFSSPFQNMISPLDTVVFLESCQRLIQCRQDRIQFALSQLLYPLSLFLFSVGLMIIFQGMIPNVGRGVFFLMVIFACLGSYIVYLFGYILSMSSADVLDVCLLMMSQGYSLGEIFDSLSFSGALLKKWRFIQRDVFQTLSFVNAFSLHFYLPLPIKHSLEMHEKMGRLRDGLGTVLPYLLEEEKRQFKLKCNGLKLSLYLLIVCGIFFLMMMIYAPILSNLR